MLLNFNIPVFLAGEKGASTEVLESNQHILNDSVKFLREQAQNLATAKSISLEDAYKLLIGVLDNYDDLSFLESQSTQSFTASKNLNKSPHDRGY